MSLRPARSAALLASLAIVLTSGLAGCGAGPGAVASLDYAPSDGLLATLGELRVQNVLIVAPPEGGDTAVLTMAIAQVGDEEDRLADVTVDGAASVRVEGSDEIPAVGQVLFGGQESERQILLEGFSAPAGGTVEVTLRFEDAGEVTLQPPVFAPTGYYEDYVAPEATPPPPTDGATPAPATPAPATPDAAAETPAA